MKIVDGNNLIITKERFVLWVLKICRLLYSTLESYFYLLLCCINFIPPPPLTSRYITKKKIESGCKSTFGVPVCFRILQSAVMRMKTTKKRRFFFKPLREIATRLLAVQACRFTFLFVR